MLIRPETFAAIKAGTGNPWAQPSWKWGAPHGNFEGNRPGKPKAGSYKEYYLATTAPAKGKAFRRCVRAPV